MHNQVNLFTAIIVLIVGIYDLSVSYNKKRANKRTAQKGYLILGVTFTLLGIILLILLLTRWG